MPRFIHLVFDSSMHPYQYHLRLPTGPIVAGWAASLYLVQGSQGSSVKKDTCSSPRLHGKGGMSINGGVSLPVVSLCANETSGQWSTGDIVSSTMGEPRAAAQGIVSSSVAFPDTTLLVGSQSREPHLISAVALGRTGRGLRVALWPGNWLGIHGGCSFKLHWPRGGSLLNLVDLV